MLVMRPRIGGMHLYIVLELQRLRQEDCEVEANLGHVARPCLRKKKKKFESQQDGSVGIGICYQPELDI